MEKGSGERLSKTDRRFFKKHNRLRHILKTEKGVEISETPTRILCIGNAGLDNGVEREKVYDAFHRYGEISDILMIPRKSYSFVIFSDVSAAESASAALNASNLYISDDECSSPVTLYIFYVGKVPDTVMLPSADIPPGLILEADFVSEEYEQRLLEIIDWADSPPEAQRELKHRQVKHFGYEFKYGVNNVDPNCPLPQGIPSVCDEFIDTAMRRELIAHRPDQLTINQYQPGQGIPPHVDTPSAFEDGLMSLSLGSQVVMDFHHPDGRQTSVVLPRRSLLVMTGESRYIWSHGITPRKSDIITSPGGGLTLMKRGTRTSFTFRKIIHHREVTSNLHAAHNEISEERQTLPQTELEASRLESEHVHKVYEEIASHFSSTRHSAWPQISQFIRTLPPASFLVDIGCGNGKYLGINPSIYEVGSDRSMNLAEICHGRGHETLVGDVLKIPLRSSSFDVCLCIAVIHHLSTQERRLKAIEELVRILVVGGQALIYVWAMEQEVSNVRSKYIQGSRKNKPATVSDVNAETAVCHNCDCTSSMPSTNEWNNVARDNLEHEALKKSGIKKSEPGDHASSYILPCPAFSAQQVHSVKSGNVSMNSFDSHQLRHNHNSRGSDLDSQMLDSVTNREDNSSEHPVLSSDQNDTNSSLKVHVNRTQFKQQDLLVPWQLKKQQNPLISKKVQEENKTFHRFYHVFKEGELESLCRNISNVKIRKTYYDQGNWCVLLEKIK